MPAVGDMIGHASPEELRVGLDETLAFLHGLFLPHMEQAEAALYPELERLLQNRHAMTPMRREHAEIRELISTLSELRAHLDAGPLHMGECVALRRVVFRLYALLKVHLAEEHLYVGILERGASEQGSADLAAAMDHAGITSL
jgi:iron-sulfur cluster repair protein YtfE (RIC family)